MSNVSLVSGHIDAPDNGVYCKQCEHADFDCASDTGVCKIGRLDIIQADSYCSAGGTKRD